MPILIRISILCLLVFPVLLSEEDNKATVSLIIESTDITSSITVGVKFEMEPGWYIYWQNPGDAGLPVDVTWHLPEGFTATGLQYPVPEKYKEGELVYYGHKNKAVLLAEITPPQKIIQKDDIRIKADLSWMVCRESCYLENASVELSLSGTTPAATEIAHYREKMPRSIHMVDLVVNRAEIVKEVNDLVVSIGFTGRDASRITDFYPDALDGFILQHSKISVSDNTVTFPITPFGANSSLAILGGLVIVDGMGYYIEVPLSGTIP